MLPARHRLLRRSAFAHAVRGSRAGSPLLVVHARLRSTPAGAPRVGFAVSRIVGNAVIRNRTKRRLRALVAREVTDLPDGVDVVVRAQPAAGAADSSQLGTDLRRLLAKAVGSAVAGASGRSRSCRC